MEVKPEKIEIIDFSGEEFNRISIPCSVGLAIMILTASINFLVMFLFPGSYVSIYVSLVIIISLVLYYSYLLSQNSGEIRKFSISTENIELILPNVPIFTITWSELEKIEIRLRKLDFKPYYRYELRFINQKSEKTCNINMLDFHKEKIDQILLLLKNYAQKMKKGFTAVKETNISGVILVENLKI